MRLTVAHVNVGGVWERELRYDFVYLVMILLGNTFQFTLHA